MNIPKVIQLQQFYQQPEIKDVIGDLRGKISQFNLCAKIKQGDKIAITAGSRGIKDMTTIIKQLVIEIKECGGDPFIVPAMGSHGGGTAEGQREILASLGITGETMNAPIRATMEVVNIGETEYKTPVYMDKYAYHADGIIVVNRIKMHTDHDNQTESGLLKMMTVGLGKQKQAELVHSYGVWGLKNLILAGAKIVLNSKKILAGIAIVENARDNTAQLEVIEPFEILGREIELFKLS
ncbi:MAG TPA: lactate racemase domain-containing protein, partial [Atribacterota bacterium]|nr:lactate racemase domain-containing protein [Atribacterota bacterium]